MLTHFVGSLYSQLEAGHVLVIGGKTIDGAERLELSLETGKNRQDNIALHISVRFHKDIIIRRSRVDNEWTSQEIEENLSGDFVSPNPLVPGERFRFYIFIGDRFHVAINDHPFCTFDFRLPVDQVRVVKVDKDVQLVSQVDQRRTFPSPCPSLQMNEDILAFSNDIPKQFLVGHVLVITGIPYGNPKGRFIIFFTEGHTEKQALHFNPRFSEGVVVRNSMKDDLTFREEERQGVFPFIMDQQFKLSIGLARDKFLFAINGTQFTHYTYRTKNQLELLNGFKVKCTLGMQIEITAVDHVYTGSPNCDGYETYSHPDVFLN